MLRLRKLEPTDLPFLYQWENDASAWADGANHNPLSQQDLRNYIESTTGDIYRDGQLRLIIEETSNPLTSNPLTSNPLTSNPLTSNPLTSNPLTLGCIDLFDFDPRNRRAAIGMYIAPEHRGKGVGKEALRLLEQYAFGHLNLRVLYAVIATKNIACTTLYRNTGYTSSPLPSWTLEDDANIWIKNQQ